VKRLIAVVVAVCALSQVRAAEIFPTAQGTAWNYAMTQEFGEGVHPGAEMNGKVDANGRLHLPITIYAAGPKEIDGVTAQTFETHRQGKVQLTEYFKVDDDAVTAIARAGEDGEIMKAVPPQKVLPLRPRVGEKWTWKGKIGDIEARQTYEILAKENVTVPAGKFDAFHLRVTQSGLPAVTEDRWFVPEIGYVKILSAMKRPDGNLLQRILLELSEGPKKGDRPAAAASSTHETKLLHAAIAPDQLAKPNDEISADVPKVYARWQGENLKKGDTIRGVWIAEDVGNVAPKNFKIAEASTRADGPRAFGTFTFSKPTKGWPLGKYRIEIYDGDRLAETVKFTVKAAK
jgi:hypothetical protein